MGGNTFECVGPGKTADAAFDKLVRAAQHDFGHAGYTGTIAEKRSFVTVSATALNFNDAKALAERLLDGRDHRIDDKWGPAGCIPLIDGRWYFFGWASC